MRRWPPETVAAARTQLQSAADSIFENLAARNAKDVGDQMEEAIARLKSVQGEIQSATADSVRAHATATLQTFAKATEESAQRAVATVRSQFQSAAQTIFDDSVARSSKDVKHQLEEAAARLKSIQAEIEGAVAESLKARVGANLQSFEKTMDQSAKNSVGRWRAALAHDLTSVAKILGKNFRSEAGSNGS